MREEREGKKEKGGDVREPAHKWQDARTRTGKFSIRAKTSNARAFSVERDDAARAH